MTTTDPDVQRMVLALEQVRATERARRRKVLLWILAVVVVIAAIAIPLAVRHHEAQEREQRVNEMFEDMIGRG